MRGRRRKERREKESGKRRGRRGVGWQRVTAGVRLHRRGRVLEPWRHSSLGPRRWPPVLSSRLGRLDRGCYVAIADWNCASIAAASQLHRCRQESAPPTAAYSSSGCCSRHRGPAEGVNRVWVGLTPIAMATSTSSCTSFEFRNIVHRAALLYEDLLYFGGAMVFLSRLTSVLLAAPAMWGDCARSMLRCLCRLS